MPARNYSEEALLGKIDRSRVKEQFARKVTIEPQEIYLPFPLSNNALNFNKSEGGRARTERHNDWKKTAGKEILRQRVKAYDVRVEITIYLEDSPQTKGDCSNYAKCVEDALVNHRIIVDDSKRYVKSSQQIWCIYTKGCRVSIRPAPLHGEIG